MKSVKTTNRTVLLALLTAILVLPTGAVERAMANSSSKIFSRPADHENCCNDEEEYSISAIKFLSWI